MKYIFSKIILVMVISVCSPHFSAGQTSPLKEADSLFSAKKYTEAFKRYEQLFRDGKASPAMLTKMAFIQEGLGDYSEALYYLNLYYNHTSDKSALAKMREIAQEHNLEGYEYSDFRFFINFLKKHQWEIVFSLLAISFLLLVISYRIKQREEVPITPIFFQVIVLIIAGVLINGILFKKTAIITLDDVILMSGPSAGSEPVQVIEKGHQVEVLQEGPIWYKIRFDDQPVYVRKKNIRTL